MDRKFKSNHKPDRFKVKSTGLFGPVIDSEGGQFGGGLITNVSVNTKGDALGHRVYRYHFGTRLVLVDGCNT